MKSFRRCLFFGVGLVMVGVPARLFSAGVLPVASAQNTYVIREPSKEGVIPPDPQAKVTKGPQARPDLSICPVANGGGYNTNFQGIGVYGEGDRKQTVTAPTLPSSVGEFEVRVTNPGTAPSAFKITLPPAPRGWKVVLLNRAEKGRDITRQAQSPSGWMTPQLKPGEAQQLLLKISCVVDGIDRYEAHLTASGSGGLDQVRIRNLKQMVKRIQWCESGQNWKNLPGGALTVGEFESVGFRAVGTNPSVGWFDLPDLYPKWSHDPQGKTEDLFGETVWVQFPGPGSHPFTAICGNKVTIQVDVVPDQDE